MVVLWLLKLLTGGSGTYSSRTPVAFGNAGKLVGILLLVKRIGRRLHLVDKLHCRGVLWRKLLRKI